MPPSQENHQFPDTRWTLLIRVGEEAGDEAKQALEELCKSYWYPLYSFGRRQGLSPDDAKDATQIFFSDLLRRKDLEKIQPTLGKFRSFMLAGMKNSILNNFREQRRLKRGGGVTPLSFDEQRGEERYQLEAESGDSPEVIFDRNWATAVLEASVGRLRAEYETAGRSELFGELERFLPSAEKPPTYAELAEKLEMGVSAATMTVHRMRQRFGVILKEELRHTVSTDEDFEDELKHFFSIIGG